MAIAATTLTKRIIPCLDVTDGRVVKGVEFVNLRDAGDPVELAAFYNREQYDRLVDARPIRTDYPIGRTPLVTLIKELAARRDVVSVTLRQARRNR